MSHTSHSGFLAQGVHGISTRRLPTRKGNVAMANPLCHWELMVNDLAKAKQFYGRVFDWRFDDGTSSEYTMVETGGIAGGMMTKPPGSPMPALNTYFQVNDINETLRRVVEAGGSVIVPKTEIPPGWFAMFLDIDRIPVGIVQEKKAAAS